MIWIFLAITLIGIVMLIIGFLSCISPRSLMFILRFLSLVRGSEKEIGKCMANICKHSYWSVRHINMNILHGTHMWALRR